MSESPAPTTDGDLQANGGNPLLSGETLRRMYSYMAKCRSHEERAARAKRGRGNTPVLGREAIEVATAIHLHPDDTIVSGSPGWLSDEFVTSPLKKMMAEIHAGDAITAPNVVTGECVSAAQTSIATGVASAYKAMGSSAVAILFANVNAMSSKGSEQAIAYAGEHALPVVYVVERNLWEEMNSVAAHCEDLNLRAVRYGFPAIPVDGNDAVAVYRVAQEAIARARKLGGPTFIECCTFRWYGHPALDPANYRPQQEVAQWRAKDPIMHMGNYLKKKGLWRGQAGPDNSKRSFSISPDGV